MLFDAERNVFNYTTVVNAQGYLEIYLLRRFFYLLFLRFHFFFAVSRIYH
jgi:hypothetical protein